MNSTNGTIIHETLVLDLGVHNLIGRTLIAAPDLVGPMVLIRDFYGRSDRLLPWEAFVEVWGNTFIGQRPTPTQE